MNKPTSTKNPSIKQLGLMTAKLKAKYSAAACLNVHVWNFTSETEQKNFYSIYIGTQEGIYKETHSWSECLEYYNELMASNGKVVGG